jgi:hypothetical protein
MEAGRSPLGFLLDLVAGGGAPTTAHDAREMYAEFQPEARVFGDHELEGLITVLTRFELTLCADGRVYDVVLRGATAYHPTESSAHCGAFVRVHGSWAGDGFHANCITLVE